MTETVTLRNAALRAVIPEELFKYTSGRWLVNEEHQLAQRFVKFDVDKLCYTAASLFGKETRCVRIGKVEGNYNKAFLLTMDDGNEVIAKIPCPNAGPPLYTTASEVATLKFLRSHTTLRVPAVLAWSSKSDNHIGAEYIIMEKVSGMPLAERWETMSPLERYQVIDQIVDMEKELESLEFPAYGSIYLQDEVQNGLQSYPLPSVHDPAQLFCIGPSCNRGSWHGDAGTSIRYAGPWDSFSELTHSIPQRELDLIRDCPSEVKCLLRSFDESQTVDEYGILLRKASSILPILSRDPRVTKVSRPSLWHADLHFGNILVSPEDPTSIRGIIDWQSCHIAPLFVQARFPDFLKPPKDYVPGTDIPTLPENFDELSSQEQTQAAQNKELATLSKYYEMATLGRNKNVYDALKLDRRLWEPFTCCQLFSDGSLVPLRNCLIRISQDWDHLGLPGQCPFVFTQEELKRHDDQMKQYEDRLYLWELVKDQLRTDNTGWVPIERWEATKKINQDLFDMFIETMSEELSPEAAAKKWPFPPENI